MKIDSNFALQSAGIAYRPDERPVGNNDEASKLNGRVIRPLGPSADISAPNSTSADTVKGKPLAARAVRTPQDAYKRDLLSLVTGDNTLTQDFGGLKKLLSACNEAELAADLDRLESDYADVKGMTMPEIAADLKKGDSRVKALFNAHYDLADKLRTLVNDRASGPLLEGPARNALAEFSGNLEQRAIRLESLTADFASDDQFAAAKLGDVLPPPLDEKDGEMMADKMSDMFRSVSGHGAKLEADSPTSTIRNVFSAISDAICGAVRALRGIFSGKSLPKTSTAVRCANELEGINSRFVKANNSLADGGDLTKFRKGEIVKGLFSGSLHLDRYLDLRRSGVSHGMIKTDFADENLINGGNQRPGNGHENQVFIGKYRQHDGSMAQMAVKDLFHSNLETYRADRMKPLLQPGEELQKSALKANFFASKAAQALKCGGSVPDVKGFTQNGLLKIGMSIAPGTTLPADKKEFGKDRRGSLGRYWPVKTGVDPATGKPVTKPLALIGRDEKGAIVDPKLVQNIEGGLMCEINKLEWVDALSGENGRHDMNFMLDVDLSKVGMKEGDEACDFPDKVAVRMTGIDNDKSFSYGRIGISKFRTTSNTFVALNSMAGRKGIESWKKCMDDREKAEFEKLLKRGTDGSNVPLANWLKTWLADKGVKTLENGFEVDMDKVPPPLRDIVATTICRSNSFRKPTFVTMSMYNELKALDQNPKPYLDSLEDIDAGERESARLRLKDAFAFAKALKKKGRIIDDTAKSPGGKTELKSSVELFRDPEMQKKIKQWGAEDEKAYFDDYKRAIKSGRPDGDGLLEEMTSTRGYTGGLSFYQTRFSTVFQTRKEEEGQWN